MRRSADGSKGPSRKNPPRSNRDLRNYIFGLRPGILADR